MPYNLLVRANPDLFLYDIKASSPLKHLELTGVDGVLIWENLRQLVEDGCKVQVRVPCVPGANWTELHGIAGRLHEISTSLNVELLPYHRLGEAKASWLGQEAKVFDIPDEKEIAEIWGMFTQNTEVHFE